MLELKTLNPESIIDVSVAGCLGYDVLVANSFLVSEVDEVSVAGCLGYDVLETLLLMICKD